ncbi:MAG: hypothetical protein NPMRTH1_760010 [Nitrosopumilales archaeon]|nr:MAG: hypothetical protein NPMRTH1_760010 [Nitrosopumilales archaeon]
MINVRALLSKKAGISLGLGISIVIIFQILIAIDSIPESAYSGDNNMISEAISKNPFQVYEINTVCELADLMLENNHSFQSYFPDFEKQLPTEWNERISALAAKEKFWNELTDEQKTPRGYLTDEAEIEIQEIEHRLKTSSYTMVMKYFSVNPDLEGEFLVLYEYLPYSLLWLKEYHPECMPLLEEKYG